MSKVLMAMSGGIDSTVSAMLLMEQGYEIIGCTFRSYDGKAHGVVEKKCCAETTILAAQQLAKKLGFEHHVVDFRDLFHCHVVQNFVTEYLSGRTPNPCVMCNSHIKWGALMKIADELGCDKIATGHYARIVEQGDHIYLRKAKDEQKDQTYFLWMLTEENLRRTIFPLGDYTKSEVRAIAAKRGFVELSEQKESQDICFVPDGDYRGFIVEEAARIGMNVGKAFEVGDYINANGKVVGKHSGFANYTIGQRKGLGIALGEPVYVSKIDAQNNVVQLMQHDELLTNEVRLTNTLFTGNKDECVEAKIRYRSRAVRGKYENGVVHFQEPVWGVTPGQSVVMYQEDRLVGGGIIR